MKVIEFQSIDGLPDDYDQLTREGQRQARVNACRQWTLPHRDPVVKARAVMRSLFFFDYHYLHPDPEADFDPGFYDDEPVKEPDFHYGVLGLWHTSKASITIAPRGAAKSSLIRKDILLELISRPKGNHLYATSSNPNTEAMGASLRAQLQDNERLIADWETEYGGPFKSSLYPWGVKNFWLANNGSKIRCVSSESKLRGIRPLVFWLDDPEFDAKASTSMAILRGYMDTLINRIALPMVFRPRSFIRWMATFVSKRHYAYHAMDTTTGPDGEPVAVDHRFNNWDRLRIRAVEDTDTGRVSCWPSMWPVNEAEKERLNLDPSTMTMDQIEHMIGASAFQSEMMANPGSAEDAYFDLDNDPRGRHAWWLENVDEHYGSDNQLSQTQFCYRHNDATVRVPMGAFLKSLNLFITVDTSYTTKSTSDRKVCMLMGVNKDNLLFILDLWSGRMPEHVLVSRTFRMCDIWGARLICVETVKESYALYLRMQSEVKNRVQDLNLRVTPKVMPLKPPTTVSKTEKITTLDVRFQHGLIKIPLFLRGIVDREKGEGAWWGRLVDQIVGFNPEANDGGLQHDDEIDCAAMSLMVIKGRIHRAVIIDDGNTEKKLDPFAERAKGNIMIPGTQVPYALGLQQFPANVLLPEERSGGSDSRF